MSDTSKKTEKSSTSTENTTSLNLEMKTGIDTILSKSENMDPSSLSESSQETVKSSKSKAVTFLKSVKINLGANKLVGGSNNGTDADDEHEDRTRESEPLIPRLNVRWSFWYKLWVVLFTIGAVFALLVGLFMLIWLGYETNRYHLIVKNKWTAIFPAQDMPRLKLPVHNVSLIALNGSDTNVCGDYLYASCVKFIQKQHMTELKEPDILYNFIVDQDGIIYEGRGWENCTCNGEFSHEDLTIGILVNNASIRRTVPWSIKNFLKNSEDKLFPCFTITTHNGTTLNPVVESVIGVIKSDKC